MPVSSRRWALIACAVAIISSVGGSTAARADTTGTDVEAPAFSVGTINGQDGWSSLGAAGSGCAIYDHAVTSNVGAPYSYPTFGDQSLRISNAVTSGCFGDQTFSKSLANGAGETTAQDGGLSGGIRLSKFRTQWDFASTVPGSEQPGLSTVLSPDRGDGARMSWVQMKDTPAGIDVNFIDYEDVAPYGDLSNPGNGCDVNDDFATVNVASGLDRSVPHTVTIDMTFVDGARNDTVTVTVDGTYVHTGTSWEDYFRWCTESGGGVPNDPVADASRTVDSVLLRTAGTAAPATLGKGWLIDNLSWQSFDAPALVAQPFVLDAVPGVSLNVPTVRAILTDASSGAPLPGRSVTFTAGTATICTATTNSNGEASCDATDSAVAIITNGGYTASFTSEATTVTDHGGLVRIAGTDLP